MLLLRAGNVVELTENGLMLAAFPFATYTTAIHPLEPGDRLLLYTDGILEAANTQGEEFGSNRLHALVQEGSHLGPEEAAGHIISSLELWSSKSQNDGPHPPHLRLPKHPHPRSLTGVKRRTITNKACITTANKVSHSERSEDPASAFAVAVACSLPK